MFQYLTKLFHARETPQKLIGPMCSRLNLNLIIYITS